MTDPTGIVAAFAVVAIFGAIVGAYIMYLVIPC